jgi:adenosylcobyric acid synthase
MNLMVQGTSSWAGKSLLCTALARLLARRGIRVAPFKAQNMSNNARVAEGGEIGTAQWLQARAAGVEPDVRMNPILVKPEADSRSQVVVMGRPDPALSARPWRGRPARLWPAVVDAYRSLAAEYELLVIEGAGSPAEINLLDTDLANMRTARLADARVLLVADIERGGALAHLYGTWALLDEADRLRLSGFVLNRFRGDAALLEPAPRLLEERTGVPVVAVVPRIEHGLPDEDGAAVPPARQGPRVAIVRYPRASNLDEFKALEQVAEVVWAQQPADLAGAALIILPGSKHVASDLAWLRRRGLQAQIEAAPRVIGVCGGLQMLGCAIADPHGVEAAAEGLGLLAVDTTLAAGKTTRRTTSRFCRLAAPWDGLSGMVVRGYEIRHGSSRARGGVAAALPGDLGFAHGRFLGVYLHGLFEQPGPVAALLGATPGRTLDEELDLLADAVGAHLDVDRLLEELA